MSLFLFASILYNNHLKAMKGEGIFGYKDLLLSIESDGQ